MLSSPRELLGKSIGGYHLIMLIGMGGTGAVFLGSNKDGDEMAVKILIPPLLVSDESLKEFHKRFQREAEILSQLDHPHILPVKGFGTDEASGFPYMIMPYKSGGTLIDQIQLGPLPFDKVIKYVWQLAQALNYAHARNIIHRDIKPANVLLDEDDQASLADFSIAKLFNLSTTTLTSANQMLGTPAYMAPEQVSNQPVSPATDVYELGVLTYQLLTGCLPFDVSTLLALLQRIVQNNPPPPHGIRTDLPPAASEVLFKAMAKEPKARFASAEAFALALEQSMQEVLLLTPTAQATQATKAARLAQEEEQDVLQPTEIASVPDNKTSDEAHEYNLTYANDAPTMVAQYTPPALDDIQSSIYPAATNDTNAPTIAASYAPSTLENTQLSVHPPSTDTDNTNDINATEDSTLTPKVLTHKHHRLVPLNVSDHPPIQEDRSSAPPTNQNATLRQDDQATILPATDDYTSSEEIQERQPSTSPHKTAPMTTSPQTAAIPAQHEPLARQIKKIKTSIYAPLPILDTPEVPTAPLPPEPNRVNHQSNIHAAIIKTPPQLTGNKRRPAWQIIVASILILLLTSLGIFSLYGHNLGIFARADQAAPTPLPPATSAIISIIPASKILQKTFTISAVTGLPDTNQHQVLARWISGNTQPQQRTVNGTGKVSTPATFASGTLLFTNISTTGAVSASAGATLTSNGNNANIQVVLDEAVNLPAALPNTINPNQRPTQRVRVHYAKGGIAGNIAAQKFFLSTGACIASNPACYTAINDAPFIGGVDAQNYTFVQQHDIDGATGMLQTLAPDPQTVLQDQVSGNEQWIVTPLCKSQISANHAVNDKAANVTVTITFLCSGEVFDKKGALEVAKQELIAAATNDPGSNYALNGDISTILKNAQITDGNGTVKATIDTKGTWVFQLDAIAKQDMAKTMVGKKKLAVQEMFKAEKSIKSATIQLQGGDQDTLPTNPQQIIINMQSAGPA